MGIWEGTPADPLADSWNDFADGVETASKRQFDDEPGGGALDLDTYVPGMTAPGSDAEVPENEGMATVAPEDRANGIVTGLLGSVPRQFDDDPGGGFGDAALDTAGDTADNVTGSVVDQMAENPAFGLVVALLVVVAVGQAFDFQVDLS